MKIALAQLNYHIGNFESNVAKILAALQDARKQQADLVVFAELAVCGYPPRDFLEFSDFISKCRTAVDDIAKHCTGIAAIVGAPSVNPRPEGKNLFNSAFFLAGGKVRDVRHKALLPTYDVFDEYRYFEPGREFGVIEYLGHRIALTVCEDIWDVADDPMYTLWPMQELMPQRPDIMINIAASPFSYHHAQERRDIIAANTVRYGMPLFYVNHVGAQTELIFDGGSMVIGSDGRVIDEMNYFTEDLRVYDVEEVLAGRAKGEGKADHGSRIAQVHDALVLGVKDYFSKLGFGKAVLGLSGGIDSAVTLVLAVRALGKENVLAVLMPSQYSSEGSVNDAQELVKRIGCRQETIGVEKIFGSFLEALKPSFGDLPSGVAEENIQARIRTVLLMALANKHGYVLLNTSNKSEAAVGYGTLYGDMAGGLSVIGDLYKTDVYELADYINRDGEVIPQAIVEKVPSAELRPDQKDSDSLPEYDALDKVLFRYIEERKGPSEIVAMGFDKDLVDRTLKLVNTSEHKRHQSPPVLRVSPKAFGMGRRMPIVGRYLA